MNRNIFVLALSQALGMSAAPMIILIGGIIGAELAPDKSLATLPLALMVIGGASFTVPAALLMGRIGRRSGFILGMIIALLASLAGVYAIHQESFRLFCLATLGIGANMAFVQQYRFAAAESVAQSYLGRAVSLVLVGGIIAAFLGPELAKNSRDWLPLGPYSGSFAALAGFYLLNIAIMSFLITPRPLEAAAAGSRRPLKDVILQPLYLTAVLAALSAYWCMTFIMTATPVSMHVIEGFSLADTAWVVQSHVLAMFVPSFFSGWLIDRFGLSKTMISGIILMGLCVVIALIDRHLAHYWFALVALGVGWNFLFVGGTTLLTKTYRPSERFKAQAVNDLTVYGFQATASLSAGALIFYVGWEAVNLITLPWLLGILLIILKMSPDLKTASKPADRPLGLVQK
ncbi:MAG: MFS transporter [Desulfobulbaceae bacterium]|nr:MFS transporter [Desulfobulbaceae bacterium]